MLSKEPAPFGALRLTRLYGCRYSIRPTISSEEMLLILETLLQPFTVSAFFRSLTFEANGVYTRWLISAFQYTSRN
jgi:hypothetical protein